MPVAFTYLLAFVLVLPTGWCCVDYGAPSGQPTAVKASSGCPMCAGRSAPDRQRAPAKSRSCCCEVRATPAKSVHATVPLDAQPAFVVAPLDAVAAGEAVRTEPFARGPTIPLHVLACVWLC
jgi:hypothetical protein